MLVQQNAPDRYLEFYNRERAHQGYRTQGRTPYQAFLAWMRIPPQAVVRAEAGWSNRESEKEINRKFQFATQLSARGSVCWQNAMPRVDRFPCVPLWGDGPSFGVWFNSR
jgi:hypothetical protein